MGDDRYPLELSVAEMRSLIDQAADRVVEHVASLPSQPAAYVVADGPRVARSLQEPLPEAGAPFDELLELVFERALPTSFNTASPGYLAYVPGGGVFPSAVADLIANSVNRYVGVWIAAPGLVQLEVNVIRWFCDIVGYPAEAGGVLTTGGSLANFTAVVTARRERLPDDFLAGTLYTSEQTHHSVQKAAVLAGFPEAAVREVATDDAYCIRIDELARQIAEDRDRGSEPFLIVASAGTTNTGAVDDLNAVADLAEREGMWLHTDAAYGGFFMLTERGRALMRGMERADSITLDPHKGLFLPYGNGSLLVRDPGALRRAHTTLADYMPAMQDDQELVDFCQLSPELSRDFRGLRAWLPIRLHGIDAFRRNLDEKFELTDWVTEELRSIPGIEIVAEPQLTVTAFRLAPPGRAEDELNDLNRELLASINARKNVYLTATSLRGRFVLRICIVSFRTHRERMERCVEDVRAAVREVTDRIRKEGMRE